MMCIVSKCAFFKNSTLQLKTLVSGSELLLENRILNGTETNSTLIPYQVKNYAYFGMKESRSVVMKFETKLHEVI